MRTLVDTYTTTDTKRFRNVRLSGILIHYDTLLAVSDRRAKYHTFIHALLWLTVIFLQYCNTHLVPSIVLVMLNIHETAGNYHYTMSIKDTEHTAPWTF